MRKIRVKKNKDWKKRSSRLRSEKVTVTYREPVNNTALKLLKLRYKFTAWCP